MDKPQHTTSEVHARWAFFPFQRIERHLGHSLFGTSSFIWQTKVKKSKWHVEWHRAAVGGSIRKQANTRWAKTARYERAGGGFGGCSLRF